MRVFPKRASKSKLTIVLRGTGKAWHVVHLFKRVYVFEVTYVQWTREKILLAEGYGAQEIRSGGNATPDGHRMPTQHILQFQDQIFSRTEGSVKP